MKGVPETHAASTPHHSFPGFNATAIVPSGGYNLTNNGGFTGGNADPFYPWVAGAGWTFVGDEITNYMRHIPGNTATLSQDIGTIDVAQYSVTYTTKGWTTGTVTVTIGGADSGSANGSLGTYTEIIDVATPVTQLVVFTPTSGFDGSITGISVKRLAQADTGIVTDGDFTGDGSDWTAAQFTYDTVSDNVDLSTGTGEGTIKQAVSVVTGNRYFVQFTVAGRAQGIDPTGVSLSDTINVLDTFSGYVQGNGTFTISMIVGQDTGPYRSPATPLLSSGEAGYLVFEATVDTGTLDDVKVLEAVEGGSNMLEGANGTFASDTAWTKETGWDIGVTTVGEASCDGTNLARIYQDIDIAAGRYYLVSFEVTAVSAGGVTPELGGTEGNNYNTVGYHMDVILAGDSTTYSQAVAFKSKSFNGSIDNVEVYLVAPVETDDHRVFDDIHYSYSGGGTLSGGQLSLVGQDGIIHQEDVPAKGRYEAKYKRGVLGAKGDPVVAVLSAGGDNVEGKLNANMR